MSKFIIGVAIGAVSATVYYVWQAVQEIQQIELAENLSSNVIKFPINK